MPRLTSPELEKEITEQFLFGHNVKHLSEFYDIPMLRINRILKRNGIDKIPKNMLNITLDDEKRICELYKKGFSTCDISNIFFNDKAKCDRTIANILTKNNINLRPFGSENKVNNYTFFDTIDTEEKAYWLGFIYADGNIRIDKSNTHLLQIEIEQSDSYILDLLIDSLQYKSKIKNYERETVEYLPKNLNYFKRENRFEGYNKIYKGCSLQVSNEHLYHSLIRHGVIENKTLQMNLPTTVPKELLNHFIRGYFDGDGSFSNGFIHNGKYEYAKLVFYGQHNLLEYIKESLKSLNLSDNKIFDKKKEKVSMLSYGSKNDLALLYKYLYENATIYLTRKKEKISSYVGSEVTN